MFDDIIKNKCPVCNSDLENEIVKQDSGERNIIECNTCGKFVITNTAIAELDRSDKKALLPSWLRERAEKGIESPELNREFLKTLLQNLPEYNPWKKQLMLLKAIQERTEYPGFEVIIDRKNDYPLAWAKNNDEFKYYIDSLKDRGVIEGPRTMNGGYKITPYGWDYLDEHKGVSIVTDQVFIAMYFANEMSPAWENGIKPAVEDAGYNPYRVDIEPHIGRIDSKIITEIRNSRFMIADVTKERPNVYFEAGYAKGLGLPVIWCKKNDDSKLHFDTRQFRHIFWDTPEDLKDELYNVICATVGKNME